MEIPNVFTPNGDNINDIFTITSNLTVHAKIYIFNRWGNEIFVFDDNLNVGSNIIWNGKTKNSSEVVDGVYFYKIEITDFKEEKTKISGFFFLIK